MQGLALPVKQVTLSAPMNGILAEMLVEEGDRVAAEQVLAKKDDRLQAVTAEGARLQAQSMTEIRKADLAAEEAQIMFENISRIHSTDAASEWEVRRMRLQRDQAQAVADQARENHELAQVRLRLEEERLSLYHVRAPFDATVIRTLAEPGVSLEAQDPLLALANLETLEAQIFLPVALYGRLERGVTYTLEAGSPVYGELQGALKTVDAIIDPASQTFRCVFVIDNADQRLPAGFGVRLLWPEGEAAAATGTSR
jgi:RND family efflux transporter MFP subunit